MMIERGAIDVFSDVTDDVLIDLISSQMESASLVLSEATKSDVGNHNVPSASSVSILYITAW